MTYSLLQEQMVSVKSLKKLEIVSLCQSSGLGAAEFKWLTQSTETGKYVNMSKCTED